MKKLLISLFLIYQFLYFKADISYAAIPEYNLTATEFTFPAPNVLEFEVRLMHTNPDSSVFLNTLAQYIFIFNPEYANGGTLTYTKLDSELPPGWQPYNPQVSGNQLLLAPAFFGGEYPVISSIFPGTLIVKMRLQTSASSFAGSLDLQWKNGPVNFYTRIRAYLNGLSTEITNPLYHFIDFPTSINNNSNKLTEIFYLKQNYPNPFNPVTILEFRISNFGFVSLKVFDALGKEVRTLVSERRPAGYYNAVFDGSDLPSGIYFYKLEVGEFIVTKKMIMLK